MSDDSDNEESQQKQDMRRGEGEEEEEEDAGAQITGGRRKAGRLDEVSKKSTRTHPTHPPTHPSTYPQGVTAWHTEERMLREEEGGEGERYSSQYKQGEVEEEEEEGNNHHHHAAYSSNDGLGMLGMMTAVQPPPSECAEDSKDEEEEEEEEEDVYDEGVSEHELMTCLLEAVGTITRARASSFSSPPVEATEEEESVDMHLAVKGGGGLVGGKMGAYVEQLLRGFRWVLKGSNMARPVAQVSHPPPDPPTYSIGSHPNTLCFSSIQLTTPNHPSTHPLSPGGRPAGRAGEHQPGAPAGLGEADRPRTEEGAWDPGCETTH